MDCVVRQDRQSGIDIDMIRVIRRDHSQPDCPRCSFGFIEDQICFYGITDCTCSGTCHFLGEGKGRGKLASDREGSVTCHMETQFCFRVYVSVF
ncbi:hypothetical protein E5676_scaffold1193G00060 [Cucumis melo var. makuwa]|uniref:Uncharacterized protein n=1 Tax=Cucumis melo var. makuwa TaxID=1194695 RepID=A0A5A7UUC1_CUCMM|nr:hypothetical protein E6C27_scaffold518G00070 [Cucumis melo var. makuwa]TYK14093.1 hypothetical protein E5676_scaffold1193G00060 [Cucumis melo var. makuwa]